MRSNRVSKVEFAILSASLGSHLTVRNKNQLGQASLGLPSLDPAALLPEPLSETSCVPLSSKLLISFEMVVEEVEPAATDDNEGTRPRPRAITDDAHPRPQNDDPMDLDEAPPRSRWPIG